MVLLSILKKLRRKEKEMRLLLVGLDNAGKSTILSRINGEEIDSVAPTLGFNIKTFNYADYVLNIWDVGRWWNESEGEKETMRDSRVKPDLLSADEAIGEDEWMCCCIVSRDINRPRE